MAMGSIDWSAALQDRGLQRLWYLWVELFEDIPYGDPYIAAIALVATLFIITRLIMKLLTSAPPI